MKWVARTFGYRWTHIRSSSHVNHIQILLIISFIGMGGSPGDVSEEPVTQEKRKKGWRMSCDVGEATEGLENEL